MVEMAKQLSEVDVAYQILSEKGSALYFRDLITVVLGKKGRPLHSLAHAMAEIHTQINMDSRFVYMGKGMWGLAEWMPRRGVRYADETHAKVTDNDLRRAKLLAEIQQDYPAVTPDIEETE